MRNAVMRHNQKLREGRAGQHDLSALREAAEMAKHSPDPGKVVEIKAGARRGTGAQAIIHNDTRASAARTPTPPPGKSAPTPPPAGSKSPTRSKSPVPAKRAASPAPAKRAGTPPARSAASPAPAKRAGSPAPAKRAGTPPAKYRAGTPTPNRRETRAGAKEEKAPRTVTERNTLANSRKNKPGFEVPPDKLRGMTPSPRGDRTPSTPRGATTPSSPRGVMTGRGAKNNKKKLTQVVVTEAKESSASAKSAEERARDVSKIRAAMSHTRQAIGTIKADGEKASFAKVASVLRKNLRKLNLGRKLWTKSESDGDAEEMVSPVDMAALLMNSIDQSLDDDDADLLGDLSQVMGPLEDILKSWEGSGHRMRVGFQDSVEICEDEVQYDESYLDLVRDISETVRKCEESKQRLIDSLEELESLKMDILAVPMVQLRQHCDAQSSITTVFQHRCSITLNRIKEDKPPPMVTSLLGATKEDSDSDHLGSSSDEDEKKAAAKCRTQPVSRRTSLAPSGRVSKAEGGIPVIRRLSTQKLELNLNDFTADSRRGSQNVTNSRRGSFLLQTEQRSEARSMSRRNSRNFGQPLSGRPSAAGLLKTFDFSDAATAATPRSGSPPDMSLSVRALSPRPDGDVDQTKAKKIAMALRGVRTALKTFNSNNNSLKNLITTVSTSRNPSRAVSPAGSESGQQDQVLQPSGFQPGFMGLGGSRASGQRESVTDRFRVKAGLVGRLARWNPSASYQARISTVVETLPEDVKQIVEAEPDGEELTQLPGISTGLSSVLTSALPSRCGSPGTRPDSRTDDLQNGLSARFFSKPFPIDTDIDEEGEPLREEEEEDDENETPLDNLLGRHSIDHHNLNLQRRLSTNLGRRRSTKQLSSLPKWLTSEGAETLQLKASASTAALDKSRKGTLYGGFKSQKRGHTNSEETGILSIGFNEATMVIPDPSANRRRRDSVIAINALKKRAKHLPANFANPFEMKQTGKFSRQPTPQLTATPQFAEALDYLDEYQIEEKKKATFRRVSLEGQMKEEDKKAACKRRHTEESSAPEQSDEPSDTETDRRESAKYKARLRQFGSDGEIMWRPIQKRSSAEVSFADPDLMVGEQGANQGLLSPNTKSRWSMESMERIGDLRRQSTAEARARSRGSTTENESALMIGEQAAEDARLGSKRVSLATTAEKRGSMSAEKRGSMSAEKRVSLANLESVRRRSSVKLASMEQFASAGRRASLKRLSAKRVTVGGFEMMNAGSSDDRLGRKTLSFGQEDEPSSPRGRRATFATRRSTTSASPSLKGRASESSLSPTRASTSSSRSPSSPRPSLRQKGTPSSSPDRSTSKRQSSPSLSKRNSRARRHSRRLPKPTSRPGFADLPPEFFDSLGTNQVDEDQRPRTAPQLASLMPVDAPLLPWTAPTKSVMPRLNTPRRAERRRAPPMSKLLASVGKPMRMDVIADDFNPLAKLCRQQGTSGMGNTGGVRRTHLALIARPGTSGAGGTAPGSPASKASSRRGQMELHMWGWELSELRDADIGSLVPAIPVVPDLPDMEDYLGEDPRLSMSIPDFMDPD